MGAAIRERPDRRRFISLRNVAQADYTTELAGVVTAGAGPWYLHLDTSDEAMHRAVVQAGFVPEILARRYKVPFAGVTLRRARRPGAGSYQVCAADAVSPDALFELDRRLRQDVPGLDGWQGGRNSFDSELASPEFDPSGYLVGIDHESGELVGLIRFWRNLDGPLLGLLGVVPEHRGGFLSTQLLQVGLAGASQWGFERFATKTARPSLQRRLERMGGVCTGSFAQMVRE